MNRKELLGRVKSALADAFGERLKGVILYGSEARGNADPDSDIDLLVLLESQTNYWDDVRKCVHTLYPLVLEIGRPIHAKPVAVDEYEQQLWPLYQAVKEEGIPA